MGNRLTLDMNEYFGETLKVHIRKDDKGEIANANVTIPSWLASQLKLEDACMIRVYFSKVKDSSK